MSLLTKYQSLIDTAKNSNIEELEISESNGILRVFGIAPSTDVKNKLWDLYNQIDPNYISGEVLIEVNVTPAITGSRVRASMEEAALNIRKGPGTEQPIISQAAQHETIVLLGRATDQWWLVRTENGEEGYCYTQFLESVE